jgi:hypothetical protein
VLSILEQLWHWKLPGYAAYYLPIYEENFGQLTTAQYVQALADGTPADGMVPAYFAPDGSLFSGGGETELTATAAVPEPASTGFILVAASVAVLGRRSKKPLA